jgi:Ferritin-like domain
MNALESSAEMFKRITNRRAFVQSIGLAGLGVAGASMIGCGGMPTMAAASGTDTAQQIFTAALLAEDLATTFYYAGLTTDAIIQDPNLAGAGGSATNVQAGGAVDDVGYIRAALSEEIMHADLLRSLIGGASAAGDPVQTFFFPTDTFTSLTGWVGTLEALENAFIGAYMTAVQEFAMMVGNVAPFTATQMDSMGHAYTPAQLVNFGKVCSSILGVESEHRALGRALGSGNVIANGSIPANNLCYESTDGLTSVFNGTTSAVAALNPFVTAGASGFDTTQFSLSTALAGAAAITLPCTGNPPM